jgi:hypothetical protein
VSLRATRRSTEDRRSGPSGSSRPRPLRGRCWRRSLTGGGASFGACHRLIYGTPPACFALDTRPHRRSCLCRAVDDGVASRGNGVGPSFFAGCRVWSCGIFARGPRGHSSACGTFSPCAGRRTIESCAARDLTTAAHSHRTTQRFNGGFSLVARAHPPAAPSPRSSRGEGP